MRTSLRSNSKRRRGRSSHEVRRQRAGLKLLCRWVLIFTPGLQSEKAVSWSIRVLIFTLLVMVLVPI